MNTILFLALLVCCKVVAVICTVKTELQNDQGKECGIEASPSMIHRNPWLVFLEYYRRGHLTEVRCGGTLIDSHHIVTAAHCIKNSKFTNLMARLGEYDTATKEDCLDGICADPVVRIQIVDVTVHPQYDGKGHDIAVLKLKTSAPYTDFIRPVCFPNDADVANGSTLFAAGWGEIPTVGVYSDIKKLIPLPHVPVSECERAYATELPENTICAGGQEGLDTCRGDSGGPLTDNAGRVHLRGITSLGNTRCGERGKPGIYTDALYYMHWIKEVIGK